VAKVLIPPFSSVFSALGAGNMNQLHIHEKSLYLMLYDATFRTVLSDYTVFNDTVTELEERGREDLMRQNVPVDKIRDARRTRHALRQPARADQRHQPDSASVDCRTTSSRCSTASVTTMPSASAKAARRRRRACAST
jgi:N-methylhydantoinase A/oxoprolinase/acetone carboxylase beta subunit